MLILPCKVKARKYTDFYRLDDSANVMLRTWIDSMQVIFIDKDENGNFYAIGKNYRYPKENGSDWKYDSSYYSFIISSDTCKTWQNVYKLNLDYSNIRIDAVSRINDYFLLYITYYSDEYSSQSAVYKLDAKTWKIDSVLSLINNSISPNGLFNIGRRSYINTRVRQSGKSYYWQLLENDDIEKTPEEWKNLVPVSRYSVFITKKNDSLFSISGYDSLMKSNVLWFAKPKQETSVVENAVESQNLLYMTQPVPNPASDYAKVKIYWSFGRNIEDADFKVYDLLGNVVSQDEDFEFSYINASSGELKWNTSRCPNGLYLITVNLVNKKQGMPVIIQK
jgi:hypothetical protein